MLPMSVSHCCVTLQLLPRGGEIPPFKYGMPCGWLWPTECEGAKLCDVRGWASGDQHLHGPQTACEEPQPSFPRMKTPIGKWGAPALSAPTQGITLTPRILRSKVVKVLSHYVLEGFIMPQKIRLFVIILCYDFVLILSWVLNSMILIILRHKTRYFYFHLHKQPLQFALNCGTPAMAPTFFLKSKFMFLKDEKEKPQNLTF